MIVWGADNRLCELQPKLDAEHQPQFLFLSVEASPGAPPFAMCGLFDVIPDNSIEPVCMAIATPERRRRRFANKASTPVRRA